MMEGDEYIQESEGNNTENKKPPQNQRKKKSRLENKRRFSDEQIRSLECIFESETKLEPRKKMQLARDLGLQPRQVAIWFQNRRARWKSKRIEQEYRKLKDEYDNLAARFESLKKEKDSLQLELQNLNDLMETSHDGKREEKSNWGTESKPSCSDVDREGMHSNIQIEDSKKTEKSEARECQLVNMDEKEEVPSAMGSLEKWYSVDPAGDYFDQTCSSSQWSDFWG